MFWCAHLQRLDRRRSLYLHRLKHKISESPWSVLLFFLRYHRQLFLLSALLCLCRPKLSTLKYQQIRRRDREDRRRRRVRAECTRQVNAAAHVNYNFTSKKTREYEYRSMWFNRKSPQPPRVAKRVEANIRCCRRLRFVLRLSERMNIRVQMYNSTLVRAALGIINPCRIVFDAKFQLFVRF